MPPSTGGSADDEVEGPRVAGGAAFRPCHDIGTRAGHHESFDRPAGVVGITIGKEGVESRSARVEVYLGHVPRWREIPKPTIVMACRRLHEGALIAGLVL